jgi:hypothetical protein
MVACPAPSISCVVADRVPRVLLKVMVCPVCGTAPSSQRTVMVRAPLISSSALSSGVTKSNRVPGNSEGEAAGCAEECGTNRDGFIAASGRVDGNRCGSLALRIGGAAGRGGEGIVVGRAEREHGIWNWVAIAI